jgi:ubiquitin carboxyl-terminal hydrolase 25/28
VVEEPVQVEADMDPNPFPPAEQTWDNTASYNTWNNETTWVTGWQNTSSADWAGGGNSTGNIDFDSMDYLGSSRLDQEFTIDGRVPQEEALWWNPEEREKCQRPGPGILAPVLVEDLHDSNHLLYSVIITGLPPIQATPLKDGASSSLSSDSPLPSESEARMAIPHPNAYYCPKDNGWVILSWKSSSVSPPLARSYIHASNPSLPDQSRRRRTSSCLEDSGQPFGKANRTHHFHKYERAIDSHKLTPPFRRDEWENLRQKRRTGTLLSKDLDISSINPNNIESIDEISETTTEEEEGKLLDLYVCCQCSFYCVASGVIPGVISKKCMDELQRDKQNHPIVGRTREQTVVQTIETILTWVSSCGSDSSI